MQHIAIAAAALLILSSRAIAQDSSYRRNIETGLAASGGISSIGNVGREFTAPMLIRLAYVSPDRPWGAEIAMEFNGSRIVGGVRHSEVAVLPSITRRIGRGSGPRQISGFYLSIGYNSRVVASNKSTPAASVEGLAVGLGHRLSVGRHVSLRQEYVFMDDSGRVREGVRYPAVQRHVFRIGIGFFRPQF